MVPNRYNGYIVLSETQRMTPNIDCELDRFIAKYLAKYKNADKALTIEYDADWPSPCYQQQAEQGDWVDWLPVRREQKGDLSQLESGLEITIPATLHDYYGRYWSDNLEAETQRGQLQLLMPWNEADYERLQQNLIGHVLMKRRLKQPDTLFFAVTDEEDFIISLEVSSGAVVLERVGLLPQEVLAEDLPTFIRSLAPRLK